MSTQDAGLDLPPQGARNRSVDRQRWFLETCTSVPVVEIAIDGVSMLAAFHPDEHEHRRRAELNVGAVTSTRVLHGLWLLPSGVPVPLTDVPDHKRSHLEGAKNLVRVANGCIERLYAPPGTVRAVAFGGSNVGRAFQRALNFTPIFQRLVYSDASMRPSAERLAHARKSGIGLIDRVAGTARLLLAPAAAEIGVPAVYRWWIAELAYANRIYESAQPVS